MFSCAFYFISLYPKHLKLNTLMLWRKMTVKSCKRIVYRYRPHASLDGHMRFTSESANMQAKLSLCYGKARRHFLCFCSNVCKRVCPNATKGLKRIFSCINNRQISYDCLQVEQRSARAFVRLYRPRLDSTVWAPLPHWISCKTFVFSIYRNRVEAIFVKLPALPECDFSLLSDGTSFSTVNLCEFLLKDLHTMD